MAQVYSLGAGTPTPTPTRFGSAHVVEIAGDYLMFDREAFGQCGTFGAAEATRDARGRTLVLVPVGPIWRLTAPWKKTSATCARSSLASWCLSRN
jgi:hypothetical protein